MPPTTRCAALLLVASCCCSSSLAGEFPMDKKDAVVLTLKHDTAEIVHSFFLLSELTHMALFKLGSIGNLWATVDISSLVRCRQITIMVDVTPGGSHEGEECDAWGAFLRGVRSNTSGFVDLSEEMKKSCETPAEPNSQQKGSCSMKALTNTGPKQSATMTYWFEPAEGSSAEWRLTHPSDSLWRLEALAQPLGGAVLEVSTSVHSYSPSTFELQWITHHEANRNLALERKMPHFKQRKGSLHRPYAPPPPPSPITSKGSAWDGKWGMVFAAVICFLSLLCCGSVCVLHLCFHKGFGGAAGDRGDGSIPVLDESSVEF